MGLFRPKNQYNPDLHDLPNDIHATLSRSMTKVAKLFTTGGSQAIRLSTEFRFPGKTVSLRRTKRGVLITPAEDDLEARRQRFIKLAGSCPNLPDVPPHTSPNPLRNLD
jgi:antitoxin VapB